MKGMWNKLVIGLLFGVAIVVGLLLYSDLRQIGDLLNKFPLALVGPILALTLFNYVLRWGKWHYYLGIIGAKQIGIINSAAIWVSACILALSPGKVAELLKAVALRNLTGIPVAKSAPVVVAERITDGLAMFILAAIGAFGMIGNAPDSTTTIAMYAPAYFAVLGSVIALVLATQIRSVFLNLLEIGERIPLMKRLIPFVRVTYLSTSAILRPLPLFVATGLGVVSWMGECLGFFLILIGLGLEPTWGLVWQSMFILAIATIIGGVSGLPGGLGAAELSIAGMIQVLVLHHDDPGLAGTATILVRVCTLWFGAAIGLVVAALNRRWLLSSESESSLATEATSFQNL